jgi:hypothetical protein
MLSRAKLIVCERLGVILTRPRAHRPFILLAENRGGVPGAAIGAPLDSSFVK